MLDKSRPYDIAGSKNRTLWKQDGVYYNPSTGEEVDMSVKAPVPPVKEPGLTCKLCGAVRQTPELFKEHLLAVHRDEPGVLPDKPDETEPDEPVNPDDPPVEPASLLADLTVPKLREYAKKHKIELYKLTRRADIVEAIQKAEASVDNG